MEQKVKVLHNMIIERYKLIKPLDGHEVGEIAIYDPEIWMDSYIWEPSFEGEETGTIEQEFQPDMTPEYFEKI